MDGEIILERIKAEKIVDNLNNKSVQELMDICNQYDITYNNAIIEIVERCHGRFGGKKLLICLREQL